MQKEQGPNPDLKFIGLDRSVFDGMASKLLDKNGMSGEITRISKITSLEEALSELSKCGITDEDMVACLDEWGKEMEKEFIKKPRS